MAKRMRDFDWSNHPLGMPETWPHSLRSALGICLNSSFPTAIYWGTDLRLLYNDAWAPIPGPRHPRALGAPARDIWPDIWHVIEPQFARIVETGEALFVEDQMLPMRRFGLREETYWSYSLTPIRGEDGAIAGFFTSGFETTRNILSRREMRCLLDLNETFRSATSIGLARRAAMKLLREHLGVDAACFCEPKRDGSPGLAVVDAWSRPDRPIIDAEASISQLGSWAVGQLESGHTLRVENSSTDETLGDARHVFAGLGIGAALAAPWVDDGQLVSAIFAYSREPRHWNEFDVSTTEKVLERVLLWMEREQNAQRERILMREIDHRARNTLAVVQSMVHLTQAEDIESYQDKIMARISALARTHDLLSFQRWQPIDLATLLDEELSPYADSDSVRVRRSGPVIELRPDQVQAFALLLHELTTNAAKHGALSRPDGRLNLSWSQAPDGVLTLDWEERAPSMQLSERSSSTGFGTVLLGRVVEDQLEGRYERWFDEHGISYSFRIPLRDGSHVSPARSAPPTTSQEGSTVLIVEDEPVLALDMKAIVESLGFRLFASAVTLEDALYQIADHTPDLAILDANLAGHSSEPVAELLQARGVPLIFTTAFSDLAHMSRSLVHVPRLSKPVTACKLEEAISSLGFDVRAGAGALSG